MGKRELKTIEEKLLALEEALDESKKKKAKKDCSSITYTTGDIDYNIKQFNKHAGTDFDKINADAAKAAKEVGTIPAASPDGGNTVSLGGGLTEDKIFAKKIGDYIELPPFINILPKEEVEKTIKALSPEDPFTVGYVTPIYFYKKLLDKFVLIKCTEMIGFTGVDYREASIEIAGQEDRIKNAITQIDHPEGITDYGPKFNKENNYVKSKISGMRKEYDDVNKTVRQSNVDIYEKDPITGKVLKDAEKKPIIKDQVTDLKTILFYPLPKSKPTVKYYIDFKNGAGYQEINRDLLKEKLYDAVFKIIEKEHNEGKISSTEDMTDTEIKFLQDINTKVQAIIDQDAQTIEGKELSTGELSHADLKIKPSVRALYTNQIFYLKTASKTLGKSINEDLELFLNHDFTKNLTEAKRYVKKYYIKPQNIFCSNKAEILKGLADLDDKDCIIYSLKGLGDDKDIHKLTNKDIIYYYENGILFDKNHVKVLDYELSPKHEEERKKFLNNVEYVPDAEFAKEYDDRMTDVTKLDTVKVKGKTHEGLNLNESSWLLDSTEIDTPEGKKYIEYRWNKGNTYDVGVYHKNSDNILDTDWMRTYATKEEAKKAYENQVKKYKNLTEEIENPFALNFDSINAYGERLIEGKVEDEHICCICGEPIEGYGNNPEPYMSAENGERCCDACNLKFVIPARLNIINNNKDKKESLKEAKDNTVDFSKEVERRLREYADRLGHDNPEDLVTAYNNGDDDAISEVEEFDDGDNFIAIYNHLDDEEVLEAYGFDSIKEAEDYLKDCIIKK